MLCRPSQVTIKSLLLMVLMFFILWYAQGSRYRSIYDKLYFTLILSCKSLFLVSDIYCRKEGVDGFFAIDLTFPDYAGRQYAIYYHKGKEGTILHYAVGGVGDRGWKLR